MKLGNWVGQLIEDAMDKCEFCGKCKPIDVNKYVLACIEHGDILPCTGYDGAFPEE